MPESMNDWDACTDRMLRSGLWISTGVPGVYGRSGAFESVVSAFESLITGLARQDGAEQVFFPPVMSRTIIARTGYMQSFPHFCGSVHAFIGSESEHAQLMDAVDGESDWGAHLSQTQLTLVPAACYPLYPTLSGTLGPGGGYFDVASYVFRHEPSPDPARMQMFQQKENVRLGTAQEVEAWRSLWMDRGMAVLQRLGLNVSLEAASDPFFGRGGRMLAQNQAGAQLKFEIAVPLFSDKPSTALASFNYHEDKFGNLFDIRMPSGEPAHSACLGFGLERVALALFVTHGLDTSHWPATVRNGLDI